LGRGSLQPRRVRAVREELVTGASSPPSIVVANT
jgi:hypothetical protein